MPAIQKVKKWIDNTKWDHVEENIDVVTDFRYLGAHLTTKHATNSATLDDRLTKAALQLERLRFCQPGVKAKVQAILGGIYVVALYGSEAAQITPAKFANISAAVIDTSRSRNGNHNADRFSASVAETKTRSHMCLTGERCRFDGLLRK